MKEFKCQCGETNPDNFPSNGHKDKLGLSYQRKSICKKCYAKGTKSYCSFCGKEKRNKILVLYHQKLIYFCNDCLAKICDNIPSSRYATPKKNC